MNTYQDDPDKNNEDTFDEYSIHDQPQQKSFHQKYGYDERDGPPEKEEEEHGYVDDPDDGPLNELDYWR